MLLILFFKDQYFITFLSFVTGLIGGMGIKGLLNKFSQKAPVSKEADFDEDDI